MMSNVFDLRRRIHRFLRDDNGAMSIELLFAVPLSVFIMLGSVVFFEGFQARANNVKATYAIADAFSREKNAPITPQYLDNVYRLFGGLIPSEQPVTLRVSVIKYNKALDRYEVRWSRVRGTGVQVTSPMLLPVRSAILPNMFDGEVGILVETVSQYTPPFEIGISPRTMRNFMIVRPRDSTTLCWSDNNTGPWTAPGSQIC